jgi:chorismate-pyruvate lyase
MTHGGPDGLGAKTRQFDVQSSASVEVEAIRERWAEQVNDALELAQVAERVDHRSYARQGVEWSLRSRWAMLQP